MSRRLLTAIFATPLALVLCLSCGPDETPEQRLARLRDAHEIIPVAYTTIRDADDQPTLVIDLSITNHGTEPFPKLTVMVRVTGADGVEKLAQRVTLDLDDLRPGIGGRFSAGVPGFAASDDDEVQVEIENALPDDILRSLPEWQDVQPAS